VKVFMKRNRTELKLAVLDACMNRGLKVTHIIYRTNMNPTVLNALIVELIEKELLTKTTVGKRVFFRTTARGFALLGSWRQIETALV